MSYRYAKVVAACSTIGCKAREYMTPRGRTNEWGIENGKCKACRQQEEAK